MLIRSASTANTANKNLNTTAENVKPAALRLTIRTTKDASAALAEGHALTPTVKHHHSRPENNSAPLSAEVVAAIHSASASPTPSTTSSASSTPTGHTAVDLQQAWEAIEDDRQQLEHETFDIEADKLTFMHGTDYLPAKPKVIPDEFKVVMIEQHDISDQLKKKDNAVNIMRAGRLRNAPDHHDVKKTIYTQEYSHDDDQNLKVTFVTEDQAPLQHFEVETPEVLQEPANQAAAKQPLEKFTAVVVTPLVEYSLLVDANAKKLTQEKVRAALEEAAKLPTLQHEQAFKDLKRLHDRVRVLTYTSSPLAPAKKQLAEDELNTQLLVCEALLKKAEKLQQPIRRHRLA